MKKVLYNRKVQTVTLITLCLLLLFGCAHATYDQPTTMSTAGQATTPTEKKSNNAVYSSQKLEKRTSQKLVVHFLDVGQGDATFIELPTNPVTTMLIDAGDVLAGDAVAGYVKALGYKTITHLVATHPHADHIGGMNEVFEEFDIQTVYLPDAEHSTAVYEYFLDLIITEECDVVQAKSKVEIMSDLDLAADILSPKMEEYDDLNNYSAVIRIIYGETSFLFMGDAEGEVEASLLPDVDDIDVLKVGHHGSNTSSTAEFIDKVSPTVAVISCGEDNSYGHPHAEVITRLKKHASNIYITAADGTIVIASDGADVFHMEPYITIATSRVAATIAATTAATTTTTTTKTTTTRATTTTVPTTRATTTAATTKKEVVVYVTKTGEKYHTSNCRYLSKSKIPMNLSDARKSYGPCSVCKPPK